MWSEHPDHQRFVSVIGSAGFPDRLAALGRMHTSREPLPSETKAVHEAVLKDVGITCRYFKSERFFRHTTKDTTGLWRLHLCFRPGHPKSRWSGAAPGDLELGLYLKTARGDLGGTGHGLAKKVDEARGVSYAGYGGLQLPYSTLPELTAVVRGTFATFEAIRGAVAAAGGW